MKQIILGLDPGSRLTGYGVIEVNGEHVRTLDHGVIRLSDSWSMPRRLASLGEQLNKLFTQRRVNTVVVEKVFFGKNADSAFKLGHARGVCLMAAGAHQVQVQEYAARYVKKCVTGSGAASKDHVQLVVMNLLSLGAQNLEFDATDALALAITHARMADVNARIAAALESEV